MNNHKINLKAVRIRPFEPTDADYAAVVAVYNALCPDQAEDVEEWQEEDEKRPTDLLFQRLVIEYDGQVIGQANYRENQWSKRAGKYSFTIEIVPPYQSQGVEMKVYEYIVNLLNQRDFPPDELICEFREDNTAMEQFLVGLGFQLGIREPDSRLYLPDFDAEKFRDKLEAVENSNIQIKSLAELIQLDSEWQRHLYDLDAILTGDIPTLQPITFITFEEYVRQFLEGALFLPEGMFVALDGEQYIGISILEKDLADPTHLNTGLTGVKREYRRRGIATALKVKALEFAKAYGALTIETGNEENNPMFQINLQLGFKPIPAWVEYQKLFSAGDTINLSTETTGGNNNEYHHD